jgi:hypothetical protein
MAERIPKENELHSILDEFPAPTTSMTLESPEVGSSVRDAEDQGAMRIVRFQEAPVERGSASELEELYELPGLSVAHPDDARAVAHEMAGGGDQS